MWDLSSFPEASCLIGGVHFLGLALAHGQKQMFVRREIPGLPLIGGEIEKLLFVGFREPDVFILLFDQKMIVVDVKSTL